MTIGGDRMKTIGNILLVPFKLILLPCYILATIGILLSFILEAISTVVLGKLISICIIIVLASALFYGSSLTNNAAVTGIIIAFALTIVITIIPFLIKGLQSWIKSGLSFWF